MTNHLYRGDMDDKQAPIDSSPMTPGFDLCVTTFYWRACIILVMIAAYNPKVIAAKAWHQVMQVSRARAISQSSIQQHDTCAWHHIM
jgi:hypothetical protein